MVIKTLVFAVLAGIATAVLDTANPLAGNDPVHDPLSAALGGDPLSAGPANNPLDLGALGGGAGLGPGSGNLDALTQWVADPRLSGLTTFEKCDGYIPFKEDFVCPEEKAKFNFKTVNNQIALGERPGFTGERILGELKDCYKRGHDYHPGYSSDAPTHRNRTVEFTEVCRQEYHPVSYLYYQDRAPNGALTGPQETCMVVNNNLVRQDLYFTRCVNPIDKSHDQCQLDYSSKNAFRCIQSGFIRRSVLIYCPRPDGSLEGTYRRMHYLVPTACDCRKCAHCQGDDSVFDGIRDVFSNINALTF